MDSWWTKNKWIPLSVAAGILKFVKHTPTISEFWAGKNLVRLNYLLGIFFGDDVSVSLHIGCIALNCIFISATRCKMRGGVLKKRFWIVNKYKTHRKQSGPLFVLFRSAGWSWAGPRVGYPAITSLAVVALIFMNWIGNFWQCYNTTWHSRALVRLQLIIFTNEI